MGTTNHTVLVYSSPDLSQRSFSYAGSVLPRDRPAAIYYRPKVLFNAKTRKYVLWINWRTCLPCSLHYLTAVADTPVGPFTLATKDVPLRYKDGGDFTVFIDDDGTGYLLYQSRASGHVASVEPSATTTPRLWELRHPLACLAQKVSKRPRCLSAKACTTSSWAKIVASARLDLESSC